MRSVKETTDRTEPDSPAAAVETPSSKSTALVPEVPAGLFADEAKQINVRLKKAEDYRIEAGRMLLKLRPKVEAAGVGWEAWCKVNIDRSYRDVQRVMALAGAPDPQAAVEAERERNRIASRESRERKGATDASRPLPKLVTAANPVIRIPAPATPDDEDDEDDLLPRVEAAVDTIEAALSNIKDEAKRKELIERLQEELDNVALGEFAGAGTDEFVKKRKNERKQRVAKLAKERRAWLAYTETMPARYRACGEIPQATVIRKLAEIGEFLRHESIYLAEATPQIPEHMAMPIVAFVQEFMARELQDAEWREAQESVKRVVDMIADLVRKADEPEPTPVMPDKAKPRKAAKKDSGTEAAAATYEDEAADLAANLASFSSRPRMEPAR